MQQTSLTTTGAAIVQVPDDIKESTINSAQATNHSEQRIEFWTNTFNAKKAQTNL